ncbi:MAG: hypothetical protein II817_12150 [Bacteroidales bacterium]|nr:hypothetical protein [Bacteroidales bacterium]MBQ3845700.1 hypothetical protein [Bacteroidales bacterium]
MKKSFYYVVLVLILCVSCSQSNSNSMEKAAPCFENLKKVSDADKGKLWGKTLYGPTMFVDVQTRNLVANQQNKENSFEQKGDLFFGQLPEDIIIANTSISYCGEDWTCVIWDGSRDLLTSTQLLIHESLHRIQDEIGLPSCGSSNQHLDETEGELLLKLELGILKDLLQNDSKDLTEGLCDAMTVRKYRQTMFPNGNENQFECHEGMAEYTAFKLLPLDNDNEAIRKGLVAAAIAKGMDGSGFGNSFAYLTGPAYGLLIDEMIPDWRNGIRSGKTIPDVISTEIAIPDTVDNAEIERISARYNLTEYLNKERSRLEARDKEDAELRDRFSESKWLVIPNDNINFGFNPSERLVAYDTIGVICNTMQLRGSFGTLEVGNGIMRTHNWSSFIIPYSEDHCDAKISLNPDYAIEPVDEKSFTIVKK